MSTKSRGNEAPQRPGKTTHSWVQVVGVSIALIGLLVMLGRLAFNPVYQSLERVESSVSRLDLRMDSWEQRYDDRIGDVEVDVAEIKGEMRANSDGP